MGSSFRAVAALVVFFAAIPLHAQQPSPATTPRDRLAAAIALSSLDDNSLQPWHLKLGVTIFDDVGQNPVAGTIESWHAGADERTVFTFGNATRTVLRSGGKGYASHTGSGVPSLADLVLDDFLHPGLQKNDIDNGKLGLHKQNFANMQLDCIMFSHSSTYTVAPLGLFPASCLDPGSNRLRLTFSLGNPMVIRNGIGTFQGKEVSTNLILVVGNVRMAEAKTTTLESFTPPPAEFQPDPSMKTPVTSPVFLSGAIAAHFILKHVDPEYPEEARKDHINGSVVLRVLVGRDGHVLALHPESNAEPVLAIAAIACVRQWVFRPFLVNGEPVAFSTTVTINFNFTPNPGT